MSVPCGCGGDHEPWQHPARDVRVRDLVDPLATARNYARLLDEQMQGDPDTINRLRSALADANRLLNRLMAEDDANRLLNRLMAEDVT